MMRLWRVLFGSVVTVTALSMEKPPLYHSLLPVAVGRLAISYATGIPPDQRDNRKDYLIEQGEQVKKFEQLSQEVWEVDVDEQPFVTAAVAHMNENKSEESHFNPNIFGATLAIPGTQEQIKNRLLKLLHDRAQFEQLSQETKDRIVVDTIKVCPQLGVITLMIERGANPNSFDRSSLCTLLHYAITQNSPSLVTFLLGRGANPNVGDRLEYSPLHYAVIARDFGAASLLLTYSAQPNLWNWDKNPALFYAVKKGDVAMARLLLGAGATIYYFDSEDAKNEIFERNLLALAVEQRSVEMLKLLIDARGNMAVPLDSQLERMLNAALMVAAKNGFLDVVEFLLHLDVHIAFESTERHPRLTPDLVIDSFSALSHALLNDHFSVAHALLDYSYDFVLPPHCLLSRSTSLMIAVEKMRKLDQKHPRFKGNSWQLERLIERLKNEIVKENSTSGKIMCTLCLKVAELQDIALLEFFLNYLKSKDSKMPDKLLLYAASNGSVNAIRILLNTRLDCHKKNKVGIDLSITDSHGNTPLHKLVPVVAGKNSAIISELIARGANLAAKNIRGETVMHMAMKHFNKKDQEAVIHTLIEDLKRRNQLRIVDAPDNNGQTPLMLLSGMHDEVDTSIALLLNHGANINNQNTAGQTALYIAADKNHLQNVDTLLSYDANPNLTTKSGCGPLVKAAGQGNISMIFSLMGSGAQLPLFADAMLREACKKGHLKVIEWLLNEGRADINGRSSSYGNTPLHKAVLYKQLPTVRLLLKQGAQSHVTNKKGDTPHDCALKVVDHEITELLMQHMRK